MPSRLGASPLAVLRGLGRCLILLLPALWFYIGFPFLFGLLITNPATGFSYAGIFALYLCSSPSRYETAAVLLAGLAVRVVAGKLTQPYNDFPLAPIVHLAAAAGFAAVAALIVRSALGTRRRQSLEMLVRLMIFIVLGLALGQIVDAASRLRPLKLDSFLYAVEQAYGFVPSFAAGRLFASSPWLMQVELFVYYSLPFGLAALYAMHLRRPGSATDILFLLYANALIGFTCYLIYPACGPIYAFGDAFPLHPPALADVPLAPAVMSCKPNAMPSLHYVGALLIYWNAKPFGRVGILALPYLLLTALATLGFGEHYVADLVVGSAFALLMQTLATESRARTLVAISAVAMLLSWYGLLRYEVAMLFRSRVLLWSISIATVAAAEAGRRRMQANAETARA
jgi:hypothetical protein